MTQYDDLIKNAVQHNFKSADWRLIKAQLIAESRLNPLAVSPVGARGIAQFMPKTWADVKHEMDMPPDAKPESPIYAIPACCYYMQKLHLSWSLKRPDIDRYCLALASYNAGLGNLIKAQKEAGNANDYQSIIANLHKVTGTKNAYETERYVTKIMKLWIDMVLAGDGYQN